MKITEEQIADALKMLETMLRDPTLEIRVERGIIRRPNYERNYMEAEPTGGKTITLSVNGGGGVQNESPDESCFRLMRSLRNQ